MIADEQLTGAARDGVQTRLDLWLKNHIERLLGPLFALAAAEDVTGIARGIAFQLIEAIGVLERQKVAEEVKGLDQAARASLRKYGVRFGAYHLYMPALLKPAPRSLAAQLWMLKHENPEAKGLDELQRLAGSGRTSIPVDPETPKPLYRTIGYRVCGERAIRVDILERLADLIRPALAWRQGAPGLRPPGAIDGFGFTVTGAMTSLTGASGEDFASILRSLGYRMDKRPKPPEPEPELAAAGGDAPLPESAAAEGMSGAEEAPVASDAATGTEPEAPFAGDAVEEAAPEPLQTEQPSPTLAPEATPVAEEPPSVVADEASTSEQSVAEVEEGAATTSPAETAVTDDASESSVVDDAAAGATAAAAEAGTPEQAIAADAAVAAASPAEPEMIEVWRPGGERRAREGDRQGRRRRRERSAPRPDGQPAAEAPAAAATEPTGAVAAEAAPSAESEQGRPRRHGRPRHRRAQDGEREARPGGRPERPAEQPPERRADRPERGERPDRPKRQDRSGRPNRRDRQDDNRPSRTWSSSQERRGKEPDPNSPFAKLLALKEQLESNKERQ